MSSTTSAASGARPAAALALWRFGRPHTLVGTSVSVLALAALAAQDGDPDLGTFLFHAWWTLVAALSVNLFIVGINQVEDVAIDRVNKPFLPLAAGDLSMGAGRRVVLAAGALPIALALTQGALEVAFVTVALAVGWAYSCPPLRLKRFPLLAAACITFVRAAVVNLGVWLHVADAYGAGDGVHAAVWLLGAVTIPFGLAIAVLKDVPDVDGDRRHGIGTFTVRLGPARALRLGVALLSVALAGVAAAAPWVLPALPAAALVAAHLGALGWLWRAAARVPADQPPEATVFYRGVWRLFFAEYVVVPGAFLCA